MFQNDKDDTVCSAQCTIAITCLEMLKCTLCGIIHVPYFGGTCWLNFQGDDLVLFHVNKIQQRQHIFLKHQNLVIVLQGLNTQSKIYCRNLRTYGFAWFIVRGTKMWQRWRAFDCCNIHVLILLGTLPVCAFHCCSIHILTSLGIFPVCAVHCCSMHILTMLRYLPVYAVHCCSSHTLTQLHTLALTIIQGPPVNRAIFKC